ncbi:unnamed protein product [Cunninghamella blakesleeana]
MIQTAISNYNEKKNESQDQVNDKPSSSSSLKQPKLQDCFKIIPKKKNTILDYFKPQSEKVFHLILIDIKKTCQYGYVFCIKKNMYNERLKYISISYRWGDLKVQQPIQTPDYIAQVTSFYLLDFIYLCQLLTNEPGLKDIPYLWIDAISINQEDHAKKRATLLNMNQIYKRATFILAIPDLHRTYLRHHTLHREAMDLVWKYKDIIHDELSYAIESTHSPTHPIYITSNTSPLSTIEKYSILKKLISKLFKENESKKIIKEKEELKKAYRFLAYLINDWSHRTWVMSEHQIAKENWQENGTPLKFLFLSLLFHSHTYEKPSSSSFSFIYKPFFSYTFIDQQPSHYHHDHKMNSMNRKIILPSSNYHQVDDSYKWIHFFKLKMKPQTYLDMILKSNASQHEDRFYAILPLWKEHGHFMQLISEWNITTMLSVRLRLYDIMNGGNDLWNQARLLFGCAILHGKSILPSFATCYSPERMIIELDAIDFAYDLHIYYLPLVVVDTIDIDIDMCPKSHPDGNKDTLYDNNIKDYITSYKKRHGTIFQQNLIGIQFHGPSCHLSMIANTYFLFHQPILPHEKDLSTYAFQQDTSLKLIYIPFFTYAIPEWHSLLFLDESSKPFLSGILLLGSMEMNRWVQVEFSLIQTTIGKPSLCPAYDYLFHIY